MDPEVALRRLREAIQDLKYRDDSAFATDPALRIKRSKLIEYEPLLEVIENFEALDAWLTKGGFLPTDWKRNR
jgi:hypothetical protein